MITTSTLYQRSNRDTPSVLMRLVEATQITMQVCPRASCSGALFSIFGTTGRCAGRNGAGFSVQRWCGDRDSVAVTVRIEGGVALTQNDP